MSRGIRRAVPLLGSAAALATLLLFSDCRSHHPGNCTLPLGPGRPVVALGPNHGVILAPDGSLWTWGESGFGWQVLRLGNSVRTQACLRRIGADNDWVHMAVGGSTTLALKSNGMIWGWGENLYGQLGDGTTNHEQAVPVQCVFGSDWKQVAVAGPHSVALKLDGTLWSWGNNWAGQLGDGTTNFSRAPIQVGSSTNWVNVWANLIQNVAQQADGSLWFWGWDYTRSQKGSSIPVPTRVSPDTNWVDVGMGDWMVFATKSDGTLWAWGRQAHVYTGAADPVADSTPVRVGTDNDWRACRAFAGSCPIFLKQDGSLWVMDHSDNQGAANVTAIISGLITNNQLSFAAESAALGGDPAFGIVKTLEITYRLGGTNQTVRFKEHSRVKLGGTGEKLAVIRAYYGDPRRFSEITEGAAQNAARLRRIQLPNDVVAFCGGRHASGVALTAKGEVWTWGEAMGRHTRAIPPLQWCSSLFKQLGAQVQWGDPGPVILKEPSRLEVLQEGTGTK